MIYVRHIPGRVIGKSKTEGYVDVLTGHGVMRLSKVQFVGQEITAAANIIKYTKILTGLLISDLLIRIQSLETEITKLKENAK